MKFLSILNMIEVFILLVLINCASFPIIEDNHILIGEISNKERSVIIFKNFYRDIEIKEKSNDNKRFSFRIKSVYDPSEEDLKRNIYKEFKDPVETKNVGAPLVCIEPVGPAFVANNTSLSAEKKNLFSGNDLIIDKGTVLTLKNEQKLAQIYTVSEIMQFAHSSLHNLCIMYGNRVINQKEYDKKYESFTRDIKTLLSEVTKE